MKNLVLVATSSILLTCNSFALTVSGPTAFNLRSALVKAGAEVRQLVEISAIEVRDLSCTQESGFALGPLVCSFNDSHSTQEKSANSEVSNEIRNALQQVGIMSANYRQGEYAKYVIGTKFVKCTTAYFHGTNSINCEIR